MANIEQRISAAEEKEARAKAQLLKLKAAHMRKMRKLDTRRKIVIGGAFLAWASKQKSEKNLEFIEKMITKQITRDVDRALFEEFLAKLKIAPALPLDGRAK